MCFFIQSKPEDCSPGAESGDKLIVHYTVGYRIMPETICYFLTTHRVHLQMEMSSTAHVSENPLPSSWEQNRLSQVTNHNSIQWTSSTSVSALIREVATLLCYKPHSETNLLLIEMVWSYFRIVIEEVHCTCMLETGDYGNMLS